MLNIYTFGSKILIKKDLTLPASVAVCLSVRSSVHLYVIAVICSVD